MKKIGLGIALILFAIMLRPCSSGLELAVLVLGVVGLGFAIVGSMSKKL